MKKVFLSLIICLLPISLFAEKIVVDGIFYNIYSGSFDAEVTESPDKYSGDIVIPEMISYRGKQFKVTTIGEDAFRLCDNLSSVVIPNSVVQIERGAFCDCENLKNVRFSSNLTRIKKEAFNGCKNLVEVNLPEKLSSIDVSAFAYCESLKSLVIPLNVLSIGVGAFKECSGLRSITVDKANKVYDSRNDCNAVIISSNNTLIIGCANTIIPKDIMVIGDLAFCGCKDLTNISIPNSVTNISEGAFTWSGLTSVDIPNSVTRIGKYAFQSCEQLLSVTIPESVTVIDEVAFSSCDTLQSLTFLGKDTYIGKWAFADCSQLRDVYIHSPYKLYFGEDAFENCYYHSVLHVQKDILDDYKNDNNWKNSFDDIIAIGSENDYNFTFLILGALILLLFVFIIYKKRKDNKTRQIK